MSLGPVCRCLGHKHCEIHGDENIYDAAAREETKRAVEKIASEQAKPDPESSPEIRAAWAKLVREVFYSAAHNADAPMRGSQLMRAANIAGTRLMAENAQLKATLERMGGPVTDEECALLGLPLYRRNTARQRLNELLASRRAPR